MPALKTLVNNSWVIFQPLFDKIISCVPSLSSFKGKIGSVTREIKSKTMVEILNDLVISICINRKLISLFSHSSMHLVAFSHHKNNGSSGTITNHRGTTVPFCEATWVK